MIKLIGIGIKLIGMIKQARPFSSLLPLFSLSRLLSLFSGALLSVFSCKYCSSLYSLSPHVSLLSLSLSLLSLSSLFPVVAAKVRKTPSWSRSWHNFSLSCTPT